MEAVHHRDRAECVFPHRWFGFLLPIPVLVSGCASTTTASARRTAPWTILCLDIRSPAQASEIDQIAETLKTTPGIRARDVYTVHRHDGSAGLYYGQYHRHEDPTTKRRAFPSQMRKDLSFLRELNDNLNRRLFLQALPARTPVPDVGPAEWDLENAHGLYTLQVASFEPRDDFPQFKEAAVEYCRVLREKGFEAYYHHADAGSAVTVGTFGAEAVRTGADGKKYYTAEVTNLQRQDPLQYNLVNGAIVRVKDSTGTFYAVPSRLVEIPQRRD